jgi:hypothetical protein
MSLSKFFLQTLFAFLLLIMPTVALSPPGENAKYDVSDFFGYYVQTRLLVEGRFSDSYDMPKMEKAMYEIFPVYKEEQRHNFIGLGTPQPTIFLLPLALIPASVSYLFGVFSVILAISLSLPLLADVFAISEKQYKFAVPCIALSGPVWEVVRVTKPTVFILLGFALALWFLKSPLFKNSKFKDLWAALAFQGWTFKPHEILPLLAVCFGGRQFKFVFLLIGLTIAITLITLPIMGADTYINWYETLKINMMHPEFASPQLEPTLRGQLLRFDMVHLATINHISELVFAVAMLGSMVLGNFFRNHRDYFYLVVLSLPIGFVTSLHSYSYDLILLIPSCFAFINLPFLKSMSRSLRWSANVVMALCLLTYELPIYTIIHYFFLQPNKWVINPLFISLAVLSGLFLTVALASVINEKQQPAQDAADV